MAPNPEARVFTPRRTASYQDLRGGVVHIPPQRNGQRKISDLVYVVLYCTVLSTSELAFPALFRLGQ